MIKRKVEHFEIKEYSKKEKCNFLNIKSDEIGEWIDVEYKNEDGTVFYVQHKYVWYVSQEVYEIGGYSFGFVNGKYQEFNIYY